MLALRTFGSAEPGGLLPGLAGRLGAAGLFAAARVDVLPGGHHHLAAEDADQRAVLVVAAGLDLDDARSVLDLDGVLSSTVVSP